MTRFELTVDEIVLRGVPLSGSSDLGPLVEERLARLARGSEHPDAPRWVSDEASLADLVAGRIWAEVRRATTDLAGPGS